MVAFVTNKCLIFKGSYIDNNGRHFEPNKNIVNNEGVIVQETLLQQGLDITLYGMGIVFTFLLVLVICTTIMSRFITRVFPEAEPVAASPANQSATGAASDLRLRKIIEAAIEQHRNRR
ncbi:OadG family protein [Microbulbifer sp. SA54]|uniref:OadG family protein n=1 Tax=Microbulbifer sp. SA54 TaxID=3401577 RepID=UPI003AAE198A